ncbi:MAG TPA: glycosyltransferase [Hanamia sp.]
MKVVHLQTNISSSGSAPLRLHEALYNAEIDSTILSLNSDIEQNEQLEHLGKKAKLLSLINGKLERFIIGKTVKKFGYFSYPLLGTDISNIKQIKNADILYLHWAIGGFLNIKDIEQLCRLNKPIIIFMHDMWTITGGCHHSFDCEKYKTGCNNCQIFMRNKENDLSAKEFNKKLKLYSKFNNLYFVAPSKWLFNCAKKSLLTKNKPIFYIPNVVNSKFFKPFDKNVAKQILNIDSDEIVIAFGAVSIDSPYKGWIFLQKALEILHKDFSIDKKISVLIFGSGYNKQIADSIPFKTKFVGRLRDDYSTVLIYNAADIFIAPSLAETFGLVILEALCCGTPVVGFNVGGIPDLILHKKNGYLSRYKDGEDLARGIIFCLTNNIHGYMPPNFYTDLIIKKHLELYEYIKSVKS